MTIVQIVLEYTVEGSAQRAAEELAESIAPAIRRHFDERHAPHGSPDRRYEARLAGIHAVVGEVTPLAAPTSPTPQPPPPYDDW